VGPRIHGVGVGRFPLRRAGQYSGGAGTLLPHLFYSRPARMPHAAFAEMNAT
jgi:hypothetical protein